MEYGSSVTSNSVVREVERICRLRDDRVPQFKVVFRQARRGSNGIPEYAILEDNPFFVPDASDGASKEDAIPDIPPGAPAGTSSSSESESDSDDDLLDQMEKNILSEDSFLARLLRDGVNKVEEVELERGECSLLAMYDEVFSTEDEVSEGEWTGFIGNVFANGDHVRRFLDNFRNEYNKWLKEKKKNKKKNKKKKTLLGRTLNSISGYLKTLEAEKDITKLRGQLITLLQISYNVSNLGWEDYKEWAKGHTNLYAHLCIQHYNWILRTQKGQSGFKEKSIVNVEKRNRLVKCISTAIQIGLNYQELEKFEVKHVPKTHDMDMKDLQTLNIELKYPDLVGGELQLPEHGLIQQKDLKKLGLTKVTSFDDAKLKKVLLADLNNHPYWEGIRVHADLGFYISRWRLENTSQYINPTKRETLTKIYEKFRSYDIDFDKATPDQLKEMCKLKTLELAPVVHKRVCEYFEGGTDRIEEAFRDWQKSDRSYKVLKDDIEIKSNQYITLPSIPEALEDPPQDPPDLPADIPKIINSQKIDNHAAYLISDPLVLSDAPSDMDFAKKLSDAFVELGFLPEGYERYCGVNPGEVRAKRSSDGTASPAKRQREKLFTPIEIH